MAQTLLVNTSDPETTDEDPPLAVVETSEQLRDDSLSPILCELLFNGVGTHVHGVLENREACRDEPTAEEAVPSSRPELVPDRPGGVGAELVAAGEVELVDGADQRQVADADQLGEIAESPGESPGDRGNEAKVGLDDLLPGLRHLDAEPLEHLHVSAPRPARAEA